MKQIIIIIITLRQTACLHRHAHTQMAVMKMDGCHIRDGCHEENGCHEKEWLKRKGMIDMKRNECHGNVWLM